MTSSTPTLRDVAAEAGVSPMTASNALRGKPGVKESTRAKVIAAAKKLNYRINLTASMLKSGRSNIIHVIVNEFDSPFYSKLTQALSNEIVSRGLIPFIEQTQYSPDAAEHALSSNPFSGQLFDGEILHATGLGTNVPLSKLNGGRPFVLLDACEETPTVDAVNFPNEEAERAAMRASHRPRMPQYRDRRPPVHPPRRSGACPERVRSAIARRMRSAVRRRTAL